MEDEYCWDDYKRCYEKVPRHYYHHCLSARELLDVFPEARYIILEKIKEWKEVKETIVEQEVKPILGEIKKLDGEVQIPNVGTVPTEWFWKTVYKRVLVNQKFVEAINHIQRLKRLNYITDRNFSSCNDKKGDFDKEIEKARQVPIIDIVSSFMKLERVGKKYRLLCPFHYDRDPSFYIYPETNSFYCFGCDKGGDVIEFVKLYLELDFKEAVKYLNN